MNEMIIGICPFDLPDPDLVRSICRAGGLGVLDLGSDAKVAQEALARMIKSYAGTFAVRVPRPDFLSEYPEQITTVVVPAPMSIKGLKRPGRKVLAQICSVEEARQAMAFGVDGLIAKGNESGGRVGEKSTFILLQQVIKVVDLPVWAQGGVGLYTAPAVMAATCRGVVLDSQLALFPECSVSANIKGILAAMDGSETQVVDGQRIYCRPGATKQDSGDNSHHIDAPLQRIPMGQEAAFAKPLAERFHSISNLIPAIQRACAAQIRQARLLTPLAEKSAFARAHRITYPIVQGPMSSVSDVAGFAQAVSDAGGLPFVALSLMEGEPARRLLAQTKQVLAEHTWGVGLMGFVPTEFHEKQVALLKENPPDYALIAGGRPSQAAALEQLGIKTYLHAPSPTLLELFLKQGARRFVFEGRECGGHVGPRSSFALWESVVRVLIESKHVRELDILFAGGIHDARSGAMISVLAAPLVARGARVGVLMGTAYLFTEEAISSGAIHKEYQRMAIDCRDTVLLETGPGHATRAIATPYFDHFQTERKRLEAESVTHEEIWAALEGMNLGRLRIAAKGERLVDGEMHPADEDSQTSEGLFMIGQVASLIDRPMKAVDLHKKVSEGSVSILSNLNEPAITQVSQPPARGADLAIIGMACILPQADDVDEYWKNILLAKNCITEVPDERWNKEYYYHPKGTGEKTPSKWGGFLPDVIFDPSEFGIPPRSLAAIDPVQMLSLLTAKRALQDAGIEPGGNLLERVSIFVGADAGSEFQFTYALRAAFPQLFGVLPPELDNYLPTLTEDSFPGVLINVIAGRIANRLNLGGSNYTVNAACASSLAALDTAHKDLAMGYSDVALVGGVDLHNGINDFLLFASVHALSAKGECRSFDAQADGTVLGEGIAFVVLKRLEDAERDGDRIYCTIKGIGNSSDGKQLGLTAPNQDGQTRALLRAYDRAAISPTEIELIEAHGTGTVVGDRAELKALTDFMYDSGAVPSACTLGSVKSQIGHTKCAAGFAGLIKAALAIHRGILPPTRNLETPDTFYDIEHSPFVFHKAPIPWISKTRRAGVSALGFGGTNFHVVLENAENSDREPSIVNAWPAELFLFRGEDRKAALSRAAKLQRLLDQKPNLKLADLAASVTAFDSLDQPAQIGLVADSIQELQTKLSRLKDLQCSTNSVFLTEPELPRGEIAFLFPGQGSQRPEMLAELFVLFPFLRSWLRRGERFMPYLFPKAAFTNRDRARQKQAIQDTRIAQPALGVADLAMAELLGSVGIRPTMLGGHSYGELAALTFAGSIRNDEIVELSALRAESILQAAEGDPGAMAAVSAPTQAVKEQLEDLHDVIIANINSPEQSVISGTKVGVKNAIEKLQRAGLSAQIIPVACAFHSPVVARAGEIFASHLNRFNIAPPKLQVWSNVTANPFTVDADEVRRLLCEQVTSPVRFEEQIRNMARAGARIFVEVGPGEVLTGLVKRILKDEPHHAIATDQPLVHGLRSFLEALARLSTLGVTIDASTLFQARRVRRVDLDAPVISKPSDTAWMVNGHYARPLKGPMPDNGWVPNREPIQLTSLGGPPAVADQRRATVLEYLQSMREMVESQRQVMLNYLGEAPMPKRVQAQTTKAGFNSLPSNLSAQTTSTPARETSEPVITPARPAIEVLIDILSERTGYPKEMLDLDLDLEADLGVDSIKRIEILSLLGERLQLDVDPEQDRELLEELARIKTLRGISDWLAQKFGKLQSDLSTQSVSEKSAGGQAGGPLDIEEILLSIVAERTGYPKDMLDPDLDLEADLGIDSIKRLEIVGNLNDQLVLWEGNTENVRPEVVEELARKKTLRAIGEWIRTMLAEQGQANDKDPVIESPPPPEPSLEIEVQRLVLEVSTLSNHRARNGSVAGKLFAVTEDGHGVARALSALLESRGARAKIIAEGERIDKADGILHLSALDECAQDPVKSLFDLSQLAIDLKSQWILSATALGGQFGHNANGYRKPPKAGISGFLKSLAREHKRARIRAVDLDLKEPPASLAQHLFDELLVDDQLIEVGYDADGLHCVKPVNKPRSNTLSNLEIGSESVLLITGGARGITARVAVQLAQRYGCTLHLVGRTPTPRDEEDPDTREEEDAAQIRRAIIAKKNDSPLSPAEVEKQCQTILRDREVRTTLSTIERTGVSFSYHCVDVRDCRAFGALIDQIYATHGRLDGVIHGAGVVEDKQFSDKTRESFDRVFDTKVKSALTLIERLRDDLRFLVFFSSASSVFGNRGQVDYAAANDVLDKLALYLSRNRSARVLSVNWGPWSGTGMVKPELQRVYEKQGIGLIEPDRGVQVFIEELTRGNDPQVILMAASRRGDSSYE